MDLELPIIKREGTPTCEGCPAHCCRYITVEIDRPEAKWQYDQIRWMLLHEKVSVYVDPDGDWFVEFKTRCRALGEDHLCTIYPERPDLCSSYDAAECPVWNPKPYAKAEFHSAEEFVAWMDQRGIDWRFKAHERRPERLAMKQARLKEHHR